MSPVTPRLKILLFVLALLTGFALTQVRVPSSTPRRVNPSQVRADARGIYPVLRGRELRLPDGEALMAFADEGSPALWMKSPKGGALQMGLHANGYPFLLVSDAAVRNFGLGRVDGAFASPILVFRRDDVVKMVFGLDMTKPEREPFFVHWSESGEKKVELGTYCDAPSRVCTN